MKKTRREFLAAAAAAAGVAILPIGVRGAQAVEATNALENQTLQMFDNWFAWLRNAGVPGYLGEHSTPNHESGWTPEEVKKWLTLFEFVYGVLDENHDALPVVSAHSCALSTFAKDGFRVFIPISNEGTMAERTIGRAQEQAEVLARHQSSPTRTHGMNSGAGGMKAYDFSAQKPGVYGTEYAYLGADDYSYLLSQGQSFTRIGFRWERVQKLAPSQTDAPLRAVEIDRLRASCDAAQSVGMKIVLDLHSYGQYIFSTSIFGTETKAQLGTAKLPTAAFVNFWRRFATEFKDHPAVIAYDLMNEPGLDDGAAATATKIQTWENASQQALDAVRSVDASTFVWVAGYHQRNRSDWYRGLYSFTLNHPDPWISEASENYGYTGHCYYGPGAGYPKTYDETVTMWAARGY